MLFSVSRSSNTVVSSDEQEPLSPHSEPSGKQHEFYIVKLMHL